MKSNDENIGRVGFRRDARTVDGEKGISDGKSRALIAVDERMVLREAFPQRGSLLDQVDIISRLGTIQGRFEQTRSRTPAEPA
jgi:hypothetical protein